MHTSLHWTSYLTAFLTPLIALIGIYIAYRQSVNARNKLKYELFDRRFRVYESVRELLGIAISKGTIPSDSIIIYGRAVRDAKWLLDRDIADYLLNDVWKKAWELETVADELKQNSQQQNSAELSQNKSNLLGWFGDQYDEVDRRFSKYLTLEH
jgi:hypothetical protein